MLASETFCSLHRRTDVGFPGIEWYVVRVTDIMLAAVKASLGVVVHTKNYSDGVRGRPPGRRLPAVMLVQPRITTSAGMGRPGIAISKHCCS